FALEQLARSGEEAAIYTAHAAYFLALAQHAAPQLSTEDQQLWLERLHDEHANLRAVLVRAEQRQDVDQGLRMAAALWRCWLRGGYWEEGRGWLPRLLARTEAVNDVDLATRAEALAGAGWLAHYQNDFRAAQVALEQSLACYRRLGRADGQ